MLTYKTDYLIINRATKCPRLSEVLGTNLEKIFFLKEGIFNLYSILIKLTDFRKNQSEQNLFLNRLPNLEGTKVTDRFIELLDIRYSKDGNYIKLRKKIGVYCGLKGKIPLSQFNRWIKQRKIPFVAIRVLASEHNDELDILASLFSVAEAISSARSRFYLPSSIKDCLSDQQIYVAGVIFGDGCLGNNNNLTIVDGSLESDKLIYSEQYLLNIKNIFKKEYKISNIHMQRIDNKIVLVISNKFLCRFFSFVFDIPFGYKKEQLYRPIILNFTLKENLFWRGICDTDGSFRPATLSFSLGMKQSKLLDDFSMFLKKHKISFSRRGININLFAKSLNRFAEIIGSSHPRKQQILFNNLRKGPSHKTLHGVNSQLIINNYFDLAKIPNLRIYIGDIFNSIFGSRTITEIMKATNSCRQTVHNWKNNVTAIPFNIVNRFYKNIYELLEKNKFMYTIGKKGSNKAYLPVRFTEEILNFASDVRSTKRGLHLRIRNNKRALKAKEKIESAFGIKFRRAREEYISDSSIANKFFNSFFVYGKPWEPLTEIHIDQLREKYEI